MGGNGGVRSPEDLCIALEEGDDEDIEAVEAVFAGTALEEPDVEDTTPPVAAEPTRPKPPEGSEILRGRLIPRDFVWTWTVASTILGVRFTPEGERRFYALCLCDKCIVLREVTEDEFARRCGELCRAMIEAGLNDLFLVEDKKRKGETEPRVADPTLLDRLHALQGKNRVEALTAMRSAFTWIFSDDRAIFRHVMEDGQRHVEVCIPFLVACETVGVLAEIIRKKVRADMEICKLTPRMIKSGKFPRPHCEAVESVAKAEARVDRLFRLFGK